MSFSRATLCAALVGRFSLLRVVLAAALVYICLTLWGCLMVNRMIFLPPRASYADSPEILKLEAAPGIRISALYLENPEAVCTILYSHGNAEDIGHLRPLLEEFRRRGFAVMAYDYEGYGTSAGRPSETAAYRDVTAAYRYLTREAGVPAKRIIVFGRSVGGGPAVELAVREPVGGLVLQNAFVSAYRVLTRIPLFPFDKFRNLAKIDRVRAPVLVIHGEADEIVPFWHGQRLFAAAPEPKRHGWIAAAGHNDLEYVAGESYWETLAAFSRLVQAEAAPAAGAAAGVP